MENKYLIVVDMQEDFIYGSLGSKEGQAIVSAAAEKVNGFDGTVIFTRDTHEEDYLDTQEGKNLPVVHCVRGTKGWELISPLKEFCEEKKCRVYDKVTFGCRELAEDLYAAHQDMPITSIELIGVCTDICVVSNALLVKAFLPEVPIAADASCCAGVTPEKHQAALETMASCQICIK